MNPVRSKSAWLALLTAGGMYAWQNRDKIRGWLNTQRDQLSNQYGGSTPTTGETRRIDQSEYTSPSTNRGVYDDTKI